MDKEKFSVNAIGTKKDGLMKYCEDRKHKFKIVSPPYWTSEIYGFGTEISTYGYYPYFLPLCVYTDHGPGYYDAIPSHEAETSAPVKFYHSPISVAKWPIILRKNVYCFCSPFVCYRKRKSIRKDIQATGTIAFPGHSTPSIDDARGYERYISDLKQLPPKYLPVTICMHMHDVSKGLHKIFIKNGFTVTSAGNASDQRFIGRFYDIIRKHKFATSNIPGSYMYYCVEMEIPFFIYGKKPEWFNKDDPNLPIGLYDPFCAGYGKAAYDMFYLQNAVESEPSIDAAKRQFVVKHLGLEDGISRLKMAKILYVALGKWLLTKEGCLHIMRYNFLGVLTRKLMRLLVI